MSWAPLQCGLAPLGVKGGGGVPGAVLHGVGAGVAEESE